jgi:hypothetical protein
MKKCAILVLLSVILMFSSTVSAQDISSSELHEKTRTELYNDLCEIFPEEIALAKTLSLESSKEMNFSDLKENSDIGSVVLVSEKVVGDTSYQVIVYSSGVFYSYAASGGTYSTFSGGVSYRNVLVRTDMYSNPANLLYGHSFQIKLSYDIYTSQTGYQVLLNSFNYQQDCTSWTRQSSTPSRWAYTGQTYYYVYNNFVITATPNINYYKGLQLSAYVN